MQSARTSSTVAVSVWKALFLREALARLFGARAAWFWLLAEPVLHVAILLLIYTAIGMRSVGGIDSFIWLMIGMLGYLMFNRTGTQLMNAVDANQALFAYRQVTPVDTVLVRAGLEGFLLIIIAGILLIGATLFGHSSFPADPLEVLEAFFGLWLTGIGFGLITSVVVQLVPDFDKIIKLMMTPVYFISGVMFPVSFVPQPYRDWLLFNPLVHGLEAARQGFAPYYYVVPGLSVAYMYVFALSSISLGLALHRRFALRLVTQ